MSDRMTEHHFSDQSALGVLRNFDSFGEDEYEAAVTHLEVSLNGGDPETVRSIALSLLGILDMLNYELRQG